MTDSSHAKPAGAGDARPAAPADALDQAAAGERGVGEFLKVSGNLAKAAGALTRRLTIDLGGTAVEVGKHVLEGAREGRSTDEIAAVVLNDWVEGARKILGFDEELQRVATELKKAAKPMTDYVPDPVRDVAEQVASIAPVKAVTDLAGLTVEDVRESLREKGRELLRRSTLLDDPDEHPAMSVILDEMSPDEARIVRFLGVEGPQAVVDVIAHNPMTRTKREMLHNHTVVGRNAGCIRPLNAPIYLDNLERLGVVAVRHYRLRSQRNYDLLLCQPEVTQIRKPRGRLVRMRPHYKGVELSEFGKALFKAAMETERSRLAPIPDEL
jgi:hypothetical protein